MKKLLVFAAILSFCTTETYGLWGGILNTTAKVMQQLTPNGMMQQNMGINGTQQQMVGNQMPYPYNTQPVSNNAFYPMGNNSNQFGTNAFYPMGNTAAAGINQLVNTTATGINQLRTNVGNTMQQVSNQMQYNAEIVDSATVKPILLDMITLATKIRDTYGAQYPQITAWSQTLIYTLTECLKLNKFSFLQLQVILKYTTKVCKILDTINEQAQTASQDLWDLFYKLSATFD